jgi:uncharacterized Zn finger protein (UPF0148 family)
MTHWLFCPDCKFSFYSVRKSHGLCPICKKEVKGGKNKIAKQKLPIDATGDKKEKVPKQHVLKLREENAKKVVDFMKTIISDPVELGKTVNQVYKLTHKK